MPFRSPPDLAGQPPNDGGASLLPSFLDPSAQPEPGRDSAFSEYPQCPAENPGHLGQTTVGGFGNYWHTDRGCQGIFRENISFFGFSIRSLTYRYTEVSATAYETNGISRCAFTPSLHAAAALRRSGGAGSGRTPIGRLTSGSSCTTTDRLT